MSLENDWIILGIVIGILFLSHFVAWSIRMLMSRFLKIASERLFIIDHTQFNFLKNATSFVIYTIGIIVIFNIIPNLRSVGVTLFASAGILAAIVGFASQQAFSNIIGGIFIVIFKPFRVGDNIKIGDKHIGIVEDITLRHVIINNFENKRIIIPNSIISSETITNSTITDEKICLFLEIPISYNTSIDLAMDLIREEAMNHKDFLDNRSEEDINNNVSPVIIRLITLQQSSLLLRANIWVKNAKTAFDMKCDLNKSILERFKEEKVETPYIYQNVIVKNTI